MYTIQIEIPFRSGHRLIYPYKGKCNNPHGEGFTCICIFKKETLDKNGMVMDFGKVKKKVKKWINNNLDHAYIYSWNDNLGKFIANEFKTYQVKFNPTSENLCNHIFYIIKNVLKIKTIHKVGLVESFRDSIAWYEE